MNELSEVWILGGKGVYVYVGFLTHLFVWTGKDLRVVTNSSWLRGESCLSDLR